MTKAIVAALASGCYLPQACRKVGIDYGTVKSWKRRGREGEEPFRTFLTATSDAIAKREADYAELISNAAPKDWKAAAWMLTHRYSKRWADREKVEADIHSTGEVRHIYVPTKKKP